MPAASRLSSHGWDLIASGTIGHRAISRLGQQRALWGGARALPGPSEADVGSEAAQSLATVALVELTGFVGHWRLVGQSGHDEFLRALRLPYVLRKAAAIATPARCEISVAEDGVLHLDSPVLGSTVHERFADGADTQSRLGWTSTITYAWQGTTLTSRMVSDNLGRSAPDVVRSRRYIEPGEGGRMVAENTYSGVPEGSLPAVTYRRHYERVARPAG